MTRDPRTAARLQLAGMLAVTAATAIALWVGLSALDAIFGGTVLLAITVFLRIGRRRSDAIQTMSGIGDERTRMLNVRATAFTGNMMSFVIVAWWLVSVVRGEPNETLSVLATMYALTWLGATLIYALRG